MKFCNQCGAEVTVQVPEGDTLPRFVCTRCGTVHYQNPKIVAGCLPHWEGRVLLCRRAIEPRYGLWTLPAGFMENGETVQQAAARETREEALAEVGATSLYGVYSIPHINQVYMLFRAPLVAPEFGAGIESLDVALFELDRIPWQQLAFPVMHRVLENYRRDLQRRQFEVHVGEIVRPMGTGSPPPPAST
ncbi:MAG TPA: NUDIX hydrolase [Gammaproteobacteria bacterium]|nr:NUDIX hydrolase [Gammaproteobacteria bacterium]